MNIYGTQLTGDDEKPYDITRHKKGDKVKLTLAEGDSPYRVGDDNLPRCQTCTFLDECSYNVFRLKGAAYCEAMLQSEAGGVIIYD